jgi:SAM-dependent methyltransferase
MKAKAELFTVTYKNYDENVYKEIRKETYGEDFGQNSWLTADEYRDFISQLNLTSESIVLEIASGSGGPAIFMTNETGCKITGIEINEEGVNTARKLAAENMLDDRLQFIQGDGAHSLPFPDNSVDALVCIDSMNHLKDRANVLKEFYRVLKPGGRLLYTDPIVITGIVTNEEIALRSSIGFFLFVPADENERLISEAGFKNIQSRNVTENMATVSRKWRDAREKRKKELLKIEEENNFNGLQAFFNTVYLVSSENRLSRIMFRALK